MSQIDITPIEIRDYAVSYGWALVKEALFPTVELLNGDKGNDGRRSGEVILALIFEPEIVNARVMLNADDYEVAYKAHGLGGGLVKVKGRLFPGKRVRTLDEIAVFELVEK